MMMAGSLTTPPRFTARIMTTRALLWWLCLAALAGSTTAAEYKPLAVEQFFVVPGETSLLKWHAEGEAAGTEDYTIRDYWGQAIDSGKALRRKGMIEVSLRLPAGFHELEFTAGRQTFGIAAIAPHNGARDPFFAIDSAASWLVHEDALRRGLVRILARSGIGMSRERVSWGQINPGPGDWQWESGRRYELLRKDCRAAGIAALEMFHDAPRWLGHVGKYPDDLVKTAAAWKSIDRRWRSTWGGLEIWNEPDISFGDFLPADQYAALVETLAWAVPATAEMPRVAGVFAHYHRPYLDTLARSGALDRVEVASFHTYGRALEMESLVEKYRDWLRAHGHAAMPLWITECGRPWKKGPGRPPLEQDAESALDITMKGVEARACGIARYFPFVYPYYEENDNNFGMMGRSGAPLRSMAAYAQLVRALGGKEYVGDLKLAGPLARARVFARPGEPGSPLVAVLYAGKADRNARVALDIPLQRAEGIDGRAIEPDGNRLPMPDGLAYVWLGSAASGRLVRDTLAMRMPRALVRVAPVATGSPVVLRWKIDPAVARPNTDGYQVVDESAQSRIKAEVDVFNLGPEPQETLVGLARVARQRTLQDYGAKPVRLGGGARATIRWDLDLSAPMGEEGRATLLVSAEGPGKALPRLVELFGHRTLPQVLRQHSGAVPLPIRDLGRWTPAIAGIGKMQMESGDAGWRFNCQFQRGDRWVYPAFRLPEEVDLRNAQGLAIRARSAKAATVRVFLWEGDRGAGYITPSSVIPADGRWYTAVVDFSALALSSANAPDPDGRLDLHQVRKISIGMNSQASDNQLEVSDLYVLPRKEGP